MRRIIAISLCLVVAICLVAPPSPAAADVIYVDHMAVAGNDSGVSWGHAFLTLTDALAVAGYGDEVWVAAGTYLPTGTQTTGSRSATFEIPSGVKVYGAFAGTESSVADRPGPTDIVDLHVNETILDGDINILLDNPCDPEFESCPDPVADNVFHVVTALYADCGTVLDGFTIRNGNASEPDVDGEGGGLLTSGSGLQVRNCTFADNQALKAGGGASVAGPSPTVGVDVVFIMDTSSSMDDETAALCDSIQHIVMKLMAQGIVINHTIMGITEEGNGDCVGGTLKDRLGTSVPDPSTCGEDLEPSTSSSEDHAENWGPATAIAADSYPWTTGSVRLIIPISDEAPCLGGEIATPPESGCDEHDEDAVEHTASVAQQNNVIVSPILGTESVSEQDTCILDLASWLAVR